jgi:hypothetical protein
VEQIIDELCWSLSEDAVFRNPGRLVPGEYPVLTLSRELADWQCPEFILAGTNGIAGDLVRM